MYSPTIYLFTGKGGVGKSSLAQACATKFKNSQTPHKIFQLESHTLKAPNEEISFDEISIEFISSKLKSKKLAKLLAYSKFYQSITGVLPNLKYLSIWSYLIRLMEKNRESIIIDAPSSGHLINMINSAYQFKSIFGSGLLYQDCQRIIDFYQSSLQVYYVSLINKLNLNEYKDFQSEIKNFKEVEHRLILNQAILPTLSSSKKPWLDQKIKSEAALMDKVHHFQCIELFTKNIIPQISKSLEIK